MIYVEEVEADLSVLLFDIWAFSSQSTKAKPVNKIEMGKRLVNMLSVS